MEINKPVAEGYLAGTGALIVTILWIFYSPFHPLIIFSLFLIALFCLSLSTLWQLSKGKNLMEWLKDRPMRYFILGFIEAALIVVFFSIFFSL